MDNEEKFWVVWQPESGNPSRRHSSFELAHSEAKRLAECAPQREFYVLEAVCKAAKVSVVTTMLADPAMPF